MLWGKRTWRWPCLEAAAMNLSQLEIWFLNFQEIKNWVVCWKVFQSAHLECQFVIGGGVPSEGECLEAVKNNATEKKQFPAKVLLWGVACGSSVFLLRLWQLLLILSPWTGYQLCPCILFSELGLGHLLQVYSSCSRLTTNIIFKKQWVMIELYILRKHRERNGIWQAWGKSLPEIN